MSGPCSARWKFWAQNCEDAQHCVVDPSICGSPNFSSYVDSNCSSNSSPTAFPAHLGSPDCEAPWESWGPGLAPYKPPESDVFLLSHVDVPVFSAPSAPSLHSPADRKEDAWVTDTFIYRGITFVSITWTAFWKRWQNKLKTLQASSSLNVLSSSQKNSARAWLDILILSTSSSASFRRSSATCTKEQFMYGLHSYTIKTIAFVIPHIYI